MKASQLLNEIQQIIWDKGDCEVVIYDGYTQVSTSVCDASLAYTYGNIKDDVYFECDDPDDLNEKDRAEYEENGTKVIELRCL